MDGAARRPGRLWPGVASELLTAPNAAAVGAPLPAGLDLALPLPVCLVLVGLVVAVQVGYPDRLTIRTG